MKQDNSKRKGCSKWSSNVASNSIRTRTGNSKCKRSAMLLNSARTRQDNNKLRGCSKWISNVDSNSARMKRGNNNSKDGLKHKLVRKVEIGFSRKPRETAEVMVAAEATAAINKFHLSI